MLLKIASVIWSDMQDAGHAAVVVYRKCPGTKADPAKGALPEGSIVLSFGCRNFGEWRIR